VVEKLSAYLQGLKLTLSGDYEEPVTADVVLAATGPNGGTGFGECWVDVVPSSIEGPGYSTTNAIAVNEYSQTSQPNIFAVGDCTDSSFNSRGNW